MLGTSAPARLRAKGFARHTFMCGQSGSGKTYTTGRPLRAAAGRNPSPDHRARSELRSRTPRLVARPGRELAGGAAVPGGCTGRQCGPRPGPRRDHTLCADFSDLDARRAGAPAAPRPDPRSRRVRHAAPAREASSTGRTRSPSSPRQRSRSPSRRTWRQRIENLGLADWSLWRRDGETSIADIDGRQQSLHRARSRQPAAREERSIVALAVLGRRWARRA